MARRKSPFSMPVIITIAKGRICFPRKRLGRGRSDFRGWRGSAAVTIGGGMRGITLAFRCSVQRPAYREHDAPAEDEGESAGERVGNGGEEEDESAVDEAEAAHDPGLQVV